MDMPLDINRFDFVKHIPSFICIDIEEEDYFLDFEYAKANAGITIPKNIKKEMTWYFSYTNSSLSHNSITKNAEDKLPSFFKKTLEQVQAEWEKQYQEAIETYGTILTDEFKTPFYHPSFFDKETEDTDYVDMKFVDYGWKKHVIRIPKFYDDEIVWNFYDIGQKRYLVNGKDDIHETETWFFNLYRLVEKQVLLSKQTKESQ